jgi:hypothetical protein
MVSAGSTWQRGRYLNKFIIVMANWRVKSTRAQTLKVFWKPLGSSRLMPDLALTECRRRRRCDTG